MKKSLTILAALAVLALAGTSAFAETVQYTLDGAHTSATFKVRHLLSKVPGRFQKVEGTLHLDESDLSKSSVEVTIPASSIDTDNDRRDGHLQSEDFFHAEKHPNITFKSKKVTKGEGDKFTITGDLTMRGVTKEVVLNAEKLGIMKNGANTIAVFEAGTTVNRKDYGINWNRTLDNGGFLLSDDVDIEISVEAVHKGEQQDAKAATSK
jgi:polyisoprenoid-binding protein YceI